MVSQKTKGQSSDWRVRSDFVICAFTTCVMIITSKRCLSQPSWEALTCPDFWTCYKSWLRRSLNICSFFQGEGETMFVKESCFRAARATQVLRCTLHLCTTFGLHNCTNDYPSSFVVSREGPSSPPRASCSCSSKASFLFFFPALTTPTPIFPRLIAQWFSDTWAGK